MSLKVAFLRAVYRFLGGRLGGDLEDCSSRTGGLEIRGLGGGGVVRAGWPRGACPRCHLGSSSVARTGRATPVVPRDICDLSGQPESLQLFLYSCDLGWRREGKGKAFSSPLAFPKK